VKYLTDHYISIFKMINKTMDWTVIMIFSAIGLIMGLLSVRGFTQKLEPFLWLLFGIATCLVLSKNIDNKPFLHGLLIGIAWGVINSLVQFAFFDTYLANNPQLSQNFSKPTFVHPRYFVLVTAPIIGLITGLILGGLSLLFKKLW
jgi:hypothetical protein